MTKYNKVYFLHIPKTGGRFLTKYILRPIENILKDNGIELIKSPEDMRQHAGWPSWIDDQTYIISVFRDPCEFFVSAVCHSVAIKNGLVDEDNWNIIKMNTEPLVISKDELYNTAQRWGYMKDFQSKNFMLSPDVETRSLIQEAMVKYENNENFSKEEIYKRVRRVNLMIRQKDLKLIDYNLLINKILKDLDISSNIKIDNADKEYFKNNSSEILFNSLTEEDLKYISNMFPIDKEIYENDLLFWKP